MKARRTKADLKTKWGRKALRKAEKAKKKKEITLKLTKPTCGTPQGGVITPLLANIFPQPTGQEFSHSAGFTVVLCRCTADPLCRRLCVMARYMGNRITDWLENVVEDKLKLSINREKTKVVEVKQQGASLDFLGLPCATIKICVEVTENI